MKNLRYLTQNDIRMIGGRLAYDEVFKPVKGQPGFFISNYGRLLSKRQREAKLLHPSIYKGYEKYNTLRKKNGKYYRYSFRLHQLVAQAFIPIPEWIREEDLVRLVVHHLKKVARNQKIYGLNTIDNLCWLPDWVHMILHQHEQIQILDDGKWKQYNFLDGCKKLKITPYDLCDTLKCQPIEQDGYMYYEYDVVQDSGKTITVKVREKVK